MNIFIRTSIAPYRIDLYNSLYKEGGFRMCFYRRVATDQAFNPEWLESLCEFSPDYLDGPYASIVNQNTVPFSSLKQPYFARCISRMLLTTARPTPLLPNL